MEEKEQKYCVVATKRNRKYRVMVTGPMSEKRAQETSALMQKNKLDKLCYKYFKVAKYPYNNK